MKLLIYYYNRKLMSMTLIENILIFSEDSTINDIEDRIKKMIESIVNHNNMK